MFLEDIKILIIYNPKAGKGKIKQLMPEVKKMFTKVGLNPYFHATKRKDDAYEIAGKFSKKYYNQFIESYEVNDAEDIEDDEFEPGYAEALKRTHFVYVIAAGGDGTLNEVMRGVLDSGCDVPVGIIPAGSTNDFGYSLGINGGMLKAAETALDAILMDENFKCDVAQFNGRYITYTAAFGLFSDVSYATPQKLKNTFGHAAYIMYGAKNILKNRKIPVSISYVSDEDKCRKNDNCVCVDNNGDGFMNGKVDIPDDMRNTISGDLLLGMVVSAKSVGGFRGITGKGVELDDGEAELMFVRWPKNPVMLIKTVLHAIGMVRKSSKAQRLAGDLSVDYGIKIIKIKEAEFDFEKPTTWSIDGEDGGAQEKAVIKVEKQAVSYLV